MPIMDRTWRDGDDAFLSGSFLCMADTPREAFPRYLAADLVKRAKSLPIDMDGGGGRPPVGPSDGRQHRRQLLSGTMAHRRHFRPRARAKGQPRGQEITSLRRCAAWDSVPIMPTAAGTGRQEVFGNKQGCGPLPHVCCQVGRSRGNAVRGVSAIQTTLSERKVSSPSFHVRSMI